MRILSASTRLVFNLIIVAGAASARPVGGQCTPDWLPGFNVPGSNGPVNAFAWFDDGNGLALYMGGEFESAGSSAANRIAKWNGQDWVPLGSGLNSQVLDLTVFDDGNGPALYACGSFTEAGIVQARGIARWNGSQWTSVGGGLNNAGRCMAVFNDGNGPALYVGGSFTGVGGSFGTNRIAKWNGQNWTALGAGSTNGTDAPVWSLAVYNEGSGLALYVGGEFVQAGGINSPGLAKWNGTSWSSIGGIANSLGTPRIETITSGFGTLAGLYVGGSFTSIGGVTVNNLARWKGSAWSGIGNVSGSISCLRSSHGGAGVGPAIYASGQFIVIGGVSANGVASWNGSLWSALGNGIPGSYPRTLEITETGSRAGPQVFAGGAFSKAGFVTMYNFASWNGRYWSPMSAGQGMSDDVFVLHSGQVNGATSLYAGGAFAMAGATTVNSVARWDGGCWRPVGGGVADSRPGIPVSVVAMESYSPNVAEPYALYAAGFFHVAGSSAVSNIAKWNGQQWSSLGSGFSGVPMTLKVFDDGSGQMLYVGGNGITAPGVQQNGMARWNGRAWSAVGSGVGDGINDQILAMTVHDDGNGPALYVTGRFFLAGGNPASRIAKWDGSSWSGLGTGLDDAGFALASFDDGTGAALYAGGSFQHAGGISVNRLAKWNGMSWSNVGGGVTDSTPAAVIVLRVLTGQGIPNTDGLLVGGRFANAGGLTMNNIARWDGQNWSAFGGGMNEFLVRVMTADVHDSNDGAGPSLFVGGTIFRVVDGKPSSHIARWGCPPTQIVDCNRNGIADAEDLASHFEHDYNANGVPDSCDLELGYSTDVNRNGVPDECETPPPAMNNDTCATSRLVPAGVHMLTTVGATTDGPMEVLCDPAGATNTQNDVWFRFVASCVGVVKFSLCGADFDAQMSVYTGGCPASPNLARACSDDFCGQAPEIVLNNTGNMLYRIRIGSRVGQTGIAALAVSCTPNLCPADVTSNATVNIDDLVAVIIAWGPCEGCLADVTGDGQVNIDDLVYVITHWGPC